MYVKCFVHRKLYRASVTTVAGSHRGLRKGDYCQVLSQVWAPVITVTQKVGQEKGTLVASLATDKN